MAILDITYINTYLRDDVSLPYDAWKKLYDADVDAECESMQWNGRGTFFSDLDNYGYVEANGHEYRIKVDSLYESARDLLEDLIFDGHYDVIIDVIRDMDEEEIFNIVTRMNCVKVKDNKLLLKDRREWD